MSWRTPIFLLAAALLPALCLLWGAAAHLSGADGATLEVRTEPLALHGSRLAAGAALEQEWEAGAGAVDEVLVGMVRIGPDTPVELEAEISARADDGTFAPLWQGLAGPAILGPGHRIGSDPNGVWIVARPELGPQPLGRRLRLTLRTPLVPANLAPFLRFDGLLRPGPGGSWGNGVVEGREVELAYESWFQDLTGFALPIAVLPPGRLTYVLYERGEAGDVPVRQGALDVAHFWREGHFPLRFEPVADSANRRYRLALTYSVNGSWIAQGDALGFLAMHRGTGTGATRRSPMGGRLHRAAFGGTPLSDIDLALRVTGDAVPWRAALDALPWRRVLPAWILWAVGAWLFLIGLPGTAQGAPTDSNS